MKISDYKQLIIQRSYEFIRDNSVGIVVKTPDEINKNVYSVYIGRLMSGTYLKEPYEEKVKLDSNKCLNSINKKIGDDEVTASNFINLTMFSLYNISMPRLIKGERVSIGMIDQDIKSIYIKPYCRDQIKYRPTDTLEMYIPASGNYDGADMDDTNKYYFRLDSVNKTIRLHMSDNNNEVSQYDLIFDGSNGNISLTDGKRSFTINTKNDEIFMSNENNSTITLRKDTIDISTAKFYLRATESIQIETKKKEEKVKDSYYIKTDKYTGEMKTYHIEGDKMSEKYNTAKIDDAKKREITCPITVQDGILSVLDWINSSGIAFNGGSNVAPLPTVPQISKTGSANFLGPAGDMLIKFKPIFNILMQIAIKLDAVGSAPVAPMPPTIVPLLTGMVSQLGSPYCKA